jgi:two-component system, NarL family, sensor histidine kinase DegS
MTHTQSPAQRSNDEQPTVAMLACEFHDGPCQRLSAAVHHLQASRHLQLENPEDAGKEFERGMAQLYRGILELRTLLNGLRPLHIEGQSLEEAIKDLIGQYAAEHGLQVTFARSPEDLELPPPLPTAVLRIVQEGLANVQRHSCSTTAHVAITRTPEMVCVEIEDRGCGFVPDAVHSDCFGLAGMRTRVASLQGEVRITSRLGEGTRVVAQIPLPAEGFEEQSPTVGRGLHARRSHPHT